MYYTVLRNLILTKKKLTTSKKKSGWSKLGFFCVFLMTVEWTTCPPHSNSMLGEDTLASWYLFMFLTPQHNTCNGKEFIMGLPTTRGDYRNNSHFCLYEGMKRINWSNNDTGGHGGHREIINLLTGRQIQMISYIADQHLKRNGNLQIMVTKMMIVKSINGIFMWLNLHLFVKWPDIF